MDYNTFFNIKTSDVQKEAEAITRSKYFHEENKKHILVVY